MPDRPDIDAALAAVGQAAAKLISLRGWNDQLTRGATSVPVRILDDVDDAAVLIAKALPALRAAFERLEAQKNGAYSERDKLVALLSTCFPSWLERHPDEDVDWEGDWRWIVFVNLPTGQATWHIHDSELGWFDHLTRSGAHRWDGHTTDEKYERVIAQVRAALDAARSTGVPSTEPEGD